jgi:hypothetical protein
MTEILLPSPQLQFCDAIGAPYVAGTIETYIPATTTPKDTWNDPAGGSGHLNTNPIVLDAAGRATIYGDGAYRFVLRDAAGNLVFDSVTNSVVSAAMQPVVGAATIADALVTLGVQDLIDASVLVETDRAEAAEAANATAISAETTRAEAAEAANAAAIAAETTRAETAETTLQGEIDTINGTLGGLTGGTVAALRAGSVDLDTVDGFGRQTINFVPAFPTKCIYFTLQPFDPVSDPAIFAQLYVLDASHAYFVAEDDFSVPVGGPAFWFAIGY